MGQAPLNLRVRWERAHDKPASFSGRTLVWYTKNVGSIPTAGSLYRK